MKKFIRFLSIAALLAGVFGVAATKSDTIGADAIAIPPSQVLYLKPGSNWAAAGARFAAYFFTDGGGNEWKSLTKESGVLDIYKVVAPTTSYQKLIFTRMNPDTTENNWDNKWNQTGDLDFDGTNDLFTIPSGAWDGSPNMGNWSVYDPLDHPLPPTFEAELPLFFKTTSAFMTGSTRMAAYYFVDGGAETSWVNMTEIDVGLYRVVTPELIDKEYDRVIFASMTAGINDWANVVSQTGDLVYDGTNDLFDKTDDTWKPYVERPSVTLTSTVEGITSDKVRIWIDRSGHYESGYTWAMKIGSTRYQPTGFEKALKLVGEDRHFAYYDLPTSSLSGNIGFSIVNSFDKVEVEVPEVAYSVGDSNKIWKIDYVSEAWAITKGAITERVYNTFFAKVLEGYMTCDASAVNGYMAFNLVDVNFLPRVESVWNMEGDLSDVLIKDFLLESDYETGTRETVAATNAFAKYERMQALYLIGSSTPEQTRANNSRPIANIELVVVVSMLSLSALAGFYFLKTKKQ